MAKQILAQKLIRVDQVLIDAVNGQLIFEVDRERADGQRDSGSFPATSDDWAGVPESHAGV